MIQNWLNKYSLQIRHVRFVFVLFCFFGTGVFLSICEIFLGVFFAKYLRTTAFELRLIKIV